MEVISIEAMTFEAIKQTLSSLIRNIRVKNGKQQGENLTDWIDNQDVFIMLDISPRKLLTLHSASKIPYSHIEQKIYYQKEDTTLYLEKILQKGLQKVLFCHTNRFAAGKDLFASKIISNRIVSIDQHYLHPIVRSKEIKSVEFGAKVNNIQIDEISFTPLRLLMKGTLERLHSSATVTDEGKD